MQGTKCSSLSTPSSSSFTLAPAPGVPFRAPQTCCLKGHRVTAVSPAWHRALCWHRQPRGLSELKQRHWKLLSCQTLLAPADKLLPHDVENVRLQVTERLFLSVCPSAFEGLISLLVVMSLSGFQATINLLLSFRGALTWILGQETSNDNLRY